MTRQRVVGPAAEADILHGYLWFEHQVRGLGVRFLSEIEAIFERAVATPALYEEFEPGI